MHLRHNHIYFQTWEYCRGTEDIFLATEPRLPFLAAPHFQSTGSEGASPSALGWSMWPGPTSISTLQSPAPVIGWQQSTWYRNPNQGELEDFCRQSRDRELSYFPMVHDPERILPWKLLVVFLKEKRRPKRWREKNRIPITLPKPDVLLYVSVTELNKSPLHAHSLFWGVGGAESAVLSFVITDTSRITHSHLCSMFLSVHGGQHGVMREAQHWKAGDLGLSLALSLWASVYLAVKWESWTNKFGTPSCSDTLWICKPETPGALVTTGSWDCQILTLWSIPFIVLKEGLSGPQWRGPEEQ